MKRIRTWGLVKMNKVQLLAKVQALLENLAKQIAEGPAEEICLTCLSNEITDMAILLTGKRGHLKMISHDKAITMYCAGPEGCGNERRLRDHSTMTTDVQRMCIGDKCMAWRDVDGSRGNCMYMEKLDLSVRELYRQVYPKEDTPF